MSHFASIKTKISSIELLRKTLDQLNIKSQVEQNRVTCTIDGLKLNWYSSTESQLLYLSGNFPRLANHPEIIAKVKKIEETYAINQAIAAAANIPNATVTVRVS